MSLNEGFELDGEEAIVPIEEKHALDLQSYLDTVTQTYAQVQDLDYLTQDIHRAAGMTADFALEAEKLMPGFLNEDRPIEFFTKYPTKTQLTVSLESIADIRGRLLGRIRDTLRQIDAEIANAEVTEEERAPLRVLLAAEPIEQVRRSAMPEGELQPEMMTPAAAELQEEMRQAEEQVEQRPESELMPTPMETSEEVRDESRPRNIHCKCLQRFWNEETRTCSMCNKTFPLEVTLVEERLPIPLPEPEESRSVVSPLSSPDSSLC